MIEVHIHGRKEVFKFERITPLEIYDMLGLYPSEWIAIHNKKIIPDDQIVENGKIYLIPVVSGG